MNILSLAHFTSFLIDLFLSCYILINNPKAKLNRITAILIICYSIWNFTYTFFRVAISEKEAMFWLNIGCIGWIAFPAFVLWFFIILSKEEKILKKWYFYFLIFIVPVILIYKQYNGHNINICVERIYGWNDIPANSIWPTVYYIYICIFVLSGIIICCKFINKTKFIYEKKQAIIISFSTFLTMILCFIFDVILQLLIFMPTLSSICMLIWVIGTVYSITRYKLFILSSSYAAREILTSMNDSLILIDSGGKIVEINNAALNLLNYKKDEIVDKPANILFASKEIMIDSILFDKEKQVEILSKNKLITNQRSIFLTKKNEEIPVEFSISIIQEKNKYIIGIVFIARDIRQIIKTEEQREKLDKLKNDFIANITHDFRSPLTIILNIADLAIKFDRDLNVKNKENYNLIYKSSLRLKNSVDRLLDLARMDAGKIKLKIKKTDPVSFLIKIVDYYYSFLLKSKIKIIKKLPGIKIENFYTDEEKLEEIIDNIISNAIKFVEISIGIITIELIDNEENILIRISDNGMGIPKDKLESIFNRFEQAHEEKNTLYKGTGIGLAFAKQLTEYLKGRIWAESEGEGKGTTFNIELKKGKEIFNINDFSNEEIQIKNKDIKSLLESELEDKTQEKNVKTYFTDLNKDNELDYMKALILIIDDDIYIREIVIKYLENNGYKNFITASNGKLGLEAVYKYSPDIIICDYNMPGMKGDEFHNQIINNPNLKEIPFIFLSAIADENLIIERRKKGANAYLKKPIEEKLFILTVEEQLKKYFDYLKISRLALIDELTGLNNRREFIRSLNHEITKRRYRDLSIIFFDIDLFKEINDEYGHQFGDNILKSIGNILKSSLRNYDIASRYGGDEFVVLMPDTNLKDAKYVADILRNTIQNTKLLNEGEEISFTASFGIASLKDNEKYISETLKIDSIKNIYEVKNIKETDWEKIEKYKIRISDILLNMADKSLYQAKQTICKKCGYNSEKLYVFINNKCPNCSSEDLIIGRNKIVIFE